LHRAEQRFNTWRRQISEGFVVGARDNQDVAWEKRPVVEKRDARCVFEHGV
jgi:hypothetical protein